MQAYITADEQKTINDITEPYGRGKWFLAGSGLTWDALSNLRKLACSDEEHVKKARAFLRKADTKKFIAELEESKMKAIAS